MEENIKIKANFSENVTCLLIQQNLVRPIMSFRYAHVTCTQQSHTTVPSHCPIKLSALYNITDMSIMNCYSELYNES